MQPDQANRPPVDICPRERYLLHVWRDTASQGHLLWSAMRSGPLLEFLPVHSRELTRHAHGKEYR